METLRTDVAIIGGGLGACAAAVAAARMGYRVVLTEETHWVGGQLTNQAVPPDEHPWIEEFGCTASYRRLRNGIRDYYRAHLPLTAAARADPALSLWLPASRANLVARVVPLASRPGPPTGSPAPEV